MTIINIEDLLLKDIWFTCLEYLSFKDAVEFFAFFKPEWCSQMRLEKYTIPSLKRNFHTLLLNGMVLLPTRFQILNLRYVSYPLTELPIF